MKSYFLEAVAEATHARRALSELLPAQDAPRILYTDDSRDVIAYLNVAEENEECEGPYFIQADISGRQYDQDQSVISLLRILQAALGGVIRDEAGKSEEQ